MLTTTLELLKQHEACPGRYAHLAKALGGAKAWGRDTPIPLLTILDANGLDDALWALVAVPEAEVPRRDRLARLFACDCAERALPIFERERPSDSRPRDAIAVARRYAVGAASDAERVAAADAARDAAWAAVRVAAWAAVRVAARDAAAAAARAAVWAAARDAAGVAAWAAARVAAWDAAGDAETAWQATRFRELLLTPVEAEEKTP